jgi:DedD protein
VEEPLKRRLTGAIVLVLIAVVFIPSVLDGPDGTAATVAIGLELPAPDSGSGGLEQRRYTLPTEDEGSAPDNGEQGAEQGAEQPAVAGVIPAPVATQPQAAGDARIEAWAVQVGSFASRANADGLVEQLSSNGFAAFITRIEEGGRQLYRVRVGPEQDRRRAEVLAERLASEVELTPRVVRHP